MKFSVDVGPEGDRLLVENLLVEGHRAIEIGGANREQGGGVGEWHGQQRIMLR